jgi:hypothetical protein
LTDDDAAELNQHSGNNKPVGPGSQFRSALPETLTLLGARDLRGAQKGQAGIDIDPDCRSSDRHADEPNGPSPSEHSEGAPVSGESPQEVLANPPVSTRGDQNRGAGHGRSASVATR